MTAGVVGSGEEVVGELRTICGPATSRRVQPPSMWTNALPSRARRRASASVKPCGCARRCAISRRRSSRARLAGLEMSAKYIGPALGRLAGLDQPDVAAGGRQRLQVVDRLVVGRQLVVGARLEAEDRLGCGERAGGGQGRDQDGKDQRRHDSRERPHEASFACGVTVRGVVASGKWVGAVASDHWTETSGLPEARSRKPDAWRAPRVQLTPAHPFDNVRSSWDQSVIIEESTWRTSTTLS